MKPIKNTLLTLLIILLIVGMWPIAIPAAVIYLIITLLEKNQSKKQLQELTEEVENLKKKLEEVQK